MFVVLSVVVLISCGDKVLDISDLDSAEPTPIEDSGQDAVDFDGDGFTTDEDCDDSDSTINPNEEEIPDDGIDQETYFPRSL